MLIPISYVFIKSRERVQTLHKTGNRRKVQVYFQSVTRETAFFSHFGTTIINQNFKYL